MVVGMRGFQDLPVTITMIIYRDSMQHLQGKRTLLCESDVLVKGKSFVILYTYFSFKQLMENPLVKEFSLLLKVKCFRD